MDENEGDERAEYGEVEAEIDGGEAEMRMRLNGARARGRRRKHMHEERLGSDTRSDGVLGGV
jgi:hypothetical protein